MNTINFNKYLGWLFTVLAFMAGVHTLVWLFKDPTLWLDDAMLMKSVVTRDFIGLFAGMLDYSQSAPIGWLLIVKTFETVFGNSPFVLRLTGVILYFISAWLVYLLSKNTFKYQIPMMPVAVFMSLGIVQNFAICTKPYMSDVCFSLLTLWVYYKNLQHKLPALVAFLLMALFIWFAFGALFVMGGVCAYHFFWQSALLYRKKVAVKQFLNEVAPLLVVLLSVGLYYLLWALPASKNTPSVNEDNTWTFLAFPLVPHGMKDLKLLFSMFKDFTSPIGKVFLLQYLIGFAVAVKMLWRSWYFKSFAIMVLMVMVVSSLGLYPIAIRLLLSQFVFTTLLAFWGLDQIVGNIAKNKVTVSLLLLLVFLPMAWVLKLTVDYRDKVFFANNEQYKACIDYIYKVKSPKAKIYIANVQRPMAEYYSNYETSSAFFEPKILEKGDKIWGTSYRQLHNNEAYVYRFFMQPDKVKENIEAITKYNDVYFMNVHSESDVFSNFLADFKKTGARIQKVYSFCGSDVYRYHK